MKDIKHRAGRRRIVGGLVLSLLGLPLAQAQELPSRPIRIVVPFPAGGGSDATARYYAKRLQDLTRQTFIVENRPGANSFIAAQAVATAVPDGTTLFLASNSPMVVNTVLFKSLPYHPLNDFTPVARISRGTTVLLVPQTSPIKTLGDLVAAGKKAPGKLNYASASASYQIATEELAEILGAQFNVVPYKGAAPALTDTVGGIVDFILIDVSAALPMVQAGRLRPLAVASDRRHASLPSVPTATEAGAKGFEFYNWTGLFAPAKTPQPLVDRLTQLVQQITADPETVAYMARLGGETFPADGKELRRYQVNQLEQWKRVAQRAGIQPE